MKKIFLSLIIGAGTLSSGAQTSESNLTDALDFTSGGITYTILDLNEKTCQTKAGNSVLSGSKIVFTYGNDTDGIITIPAKVTNSGENNPGEYTVTGVGSYSFHNATQVTVEDGVQYLAASAFSGSLSLTSISLPESVTSIGEYAFSGCSALTSFSFPSQIGMVPKSIFAGCSGLEKVTLDQNLTSIGEYAFSGCTALTAIAIPDGVTQMGTGAFSRCIRLSSLTIGNGLQSIPASAFYQCGALTTLTLPATVNNLGDLAFGQCGLTDITSESINPPAISSNTFSSSTFNGTLKVYKSALSAYQKSSIWGKFADIQVIPVDPEGISLDKTSLQIYLGFSGQLNASLLPQDATGEITWSSSAPTIASVDANGKVSGLRLGTADITASCGDFTATCAVSVVTNPAQSVTVSPVSTPVYVGDRVQLTATVKPATITAPVVWSVSNTDVAIIEENSGLLTAVAPGAVVVTATCEDHSGKISLTVSPVLAESVTLNQTDATLKVGDTVTLTATLTPSNVTYPEISWESSDPTVATVADGVVTATGIGGCTIRAKCGETVANCDVTVEATPAESVELSQTSATLKVSQQLQLSATVMPETTTDMTVEWTSSDETVAIVTTDGNVTALSVGSAVITATCGTVSATCDVTVEAVTATEVLINYKALTMRVNQIQQLVASVADDVTDKTITWTTSNPDVATVADGLVTAISLGSAVITAANGSVSATCEVTVEPTPVDNVNIDQSDVTLNVGNNVTLTATVTPEDATDKTITWASANEAVASVSEDGTVTGVAPGTVLITATAGGYVATCYVTVLQPAKSIELNLQDLSLELGDMEDLIATVTPADTTDTLTWSSSDTSVASVSAEGVVEAVGIGTAVITATCGEVSATCDVTVTNPSSGDTSAIEELAAEGEVFTVYSVDGVLVLANGNAEAVSSLPAGVYIVNGKKIMIK